MYSSDQNALRKNLNQMNQTEKTTRTGKLMAFMAWIAGLALLTQFFGNWQTQQINPNQSPASSLINPETISVTLMQNRLGHYLVNGTLNGQPATFMLDTGATDVVVPKELADTYQLISQGSSQSLTANGIITVGRSNIKSLSIGDITLYNVRASINPGMEQNQAILLGMSALKQLELRQQGDTLTLIQRR